MKKNLVLLRGLIREKRHWGDELINKLQNEFKDFNLILLEIPGTGQLHQMDSFLSIKDNVDFLREHFLKQVHPQDENYLFAMSLGGMFCMNWIQLYPHDFKKAIIANSSFGGLSPFYQRMQPQTIIKIPQIIWAVLNKDYLKKSDVIFSAVSSSAHKKNETVKWWAQIDQSCPISLKNSLRQLYSAMIYKLDKKNKPLTLIKIICGAKDQLCHYKCSQKIADLWQLPIAIHPTAGHELTLDDPQWVISEMKKFYV